MKFVFKKISDTLKELGVIFAGLYVMRDLGRFLLQNYYFLSVYVKTAIIFLLLSIIAFLITKISFFYNQIKKKQLELDIKKSFSEKSLGSNITLRDIPTNKKIHKWIDLAKIRATEWADDAEFHKALISYSLFVRNGKIDHFLPLGFLSKNKSEYLTIYLSGSKHLSETTHDRRINTTEEVPFYDKQPNWRRAIVAIYKHFEDRIYDEFDIYVTTLSSKHISISFTYYKGKNRVKSYNSFSFDGKHIKGNNVSGKPIIKI